MKRYQEYKHFWLLLYFPIYLIWFYRIEHSVTRYFHVIHTPIDNLIPFCEFFIIPYLLWFGYVAWGVIYFAMKNKQDYYRLCAFLFTGMTVFLIVSSLYPNGHYLRPPYFTRNNIFTTLCQFIYSHDTATNLFPSILHPMKERSSTNAFHFWPFIICLLMANASSLVRFGFSASK